MGKNNMKKRGLIGKTLHKIWRHLRNTSGDGRAKRRYQEAPARYCNRAFPGHLRNAGRYNRRKWDDWKRVLYSG